MERLMQYLDDVEDFLYAIVMAAGRIARALGAVLWLAASIATPVGIVLLALSQPPLGLGAATMLSVILLYRAVVNRPGQARQPSLVPPSGARETLQPR